MTFLAAGMQWGVMRILERANAADDFLFLFRLQSSGISQS